jgi:hypothetical protein
MRVPGVDVDLREVLANNGVEVGISPNTTDKAYISEAELDLVMKIFKHCSTGNTVHL